jgi:hypothetical protein
MKTKLIALLALIIISTAAQAQCDMYFPLKTASAYELTQYNAKEKVTGTILYTVVDVRDGGNEADFKSEVADAKGKVTSTYNYTVNCKNGEMFIDIKSMIPAETLEGYKDMVITAKGQGYYVLPTTLNVGNALPDADNSWDITAQGQTTVMTTLSLKITNRKVESKESITVPAGTFECYKITATNNLETSTFGLKIPIEMKVEEYYAPGVGLVKSVTYNKNDKLLGSSVLSKITQ